MNIHEIIAEEKIDEAPAGALRQMGRKLGAKAAGAIGMKGTAAELGGKAEVGDEANQLKVALRGYAGKTGKNVKQLDAQDLAAFLQQKGYPTTALNGVSGIITPKQVDDLLLKSAQAKHTAKGGTTPSAASAGAADAVSQAAQGGGSQAAGDKGPGFLDKLQQKVGATPVSKKAEPAPVDANNDGKDDKTGNVIPMKKPGTTNAGVPADIQAQLDKLTPKEKQALAGALK